MQSWPRRHVTTHLHPRKLATWQELKISTWVMKSEYDRIMKRLEIKRSNDVDLIVASSWLVQLLLAEISSQLLDVSLNFCRDNSGISFISSPNMKLIVFVCLVIISCCQQTGISKNQLFLNYFNSCMSIGNVSSLRLSFLVWSMDQCYLDGLLLFAMIFV